MYQQSNNLAAKKLRKLKVRLMAYYDQVKWYHLDKNHFYSLKTFSLRKNQSIVEKAMFYAMSYQSVIKLNNNRVFSHKESRLKIAAKTTSHTDWKIRLCKQFFIIVILNYKYQKKRFPGFFLPKDFRKKLIGTKNVVYSGKINFRTTPTHLGKLNTQMPGKYI